MNPLEKATKSDYYCASCSIIFGINQGRAFIMNDQINNLPAIHRKRAVVIGGELPACWPRSHFLQLSIRSH